jgi:hypothetical protein
MNPRRNFMRFLAAAVPGSAVLATGVARADDGSANDFLGAWTTVHTIPGGGSFTEFLTFASGGGLTETNSFLHTSSNLDFSSFGVPLSGVNASDGMGNWERTGSRQIKVEFRKLMFIAGRYGADFKVEGTLSLNGEILSANWTRIAVEVIGGPVILLGSATSTGTRIQFDRQS